MAKKLKTITSAAFDERFDAGESILEYLDLTQLRRPGIENLPTPEELLEADETVRVTLAISKRSLNYLKDYAANAGGSYQRMIRHLLNAYVDSCKQLTKDIKDPV